MNAPEIIRGILATGMLAMLVLAVFYLRTRHLAWWQFFAWGLLAALVPIVGPFLVIALRPTGHPGLRRSAALRRAHPRGLGRVI